MAHDFSVRAVDARELMDDPDADQRLLERTYAQFVFVNRALARWRRVYVHDIRPRAAWATVRVLDVGAGGADLARAVDQWLQRDGFKGEVVALDSDDRAVRWARAHSKNSSVTYRTALLSELVAADEMYDVVLSNHVLHHLSSHDLLPFLEDSAALVADGGVVAHHDIERSRGAYGLFAAATWSFQTTVLADSFIREDGLTSIRRSYTAEELSALVPRNWVVRKRLPARLELRWEPKHA